MFVINDVTKQTGAAREQVTEIIDALAQVIAADHPEAAQALADEVAREAAPAENQPSLF